jgi:ribose transport system substrate-binding protein
MKIVPLVLAAALSLAACGGGTGSAVAAGGGTTHYTGTMIADELGPFCNTECKKALTLKADPASLTCKVAYSNGTTQNQSMATTTRRFLDKAPKWFPNMPVQALDAQGDASTQSNQIDTLVATGTKIIILLPQVAEALAPAVKRAEAKGVKFVIIDRTTPAPSETTIKSYDEPIGEAIAQYVADQAKGKDVNIAILSGTPAASPTIDRRKGMMNVVNKHPNMHIVADVNGNYNQADGNKAAADLLQRFPKGQLNWVMSMADDMSLGFITAMDAAGRSGEIRIASTGGQEESFAAIKQGKLEASIIYAQSQPHGLVAAAKVCAGEPLPQNITLDYPLVTKANVDQYFGTNY